jgi:hypothetical protein
MKVAVRQALTVAFVAAGALLPVHVPGSTKALVAVTVSAVERGADLQGTWILNKDLGADPVGELESRRVRRPVGAGGMGGPASGGGLGGPLIGGRRRIDREDAAEMARVKELLRQIMMAPGRITISVDGPVIEVAGDDGTIRRLHADGKKLRDRSYPGLDVERKTKWDGNDLVSDLELKDSETKARETWTRTGTRLRIVTKFTPPNGAEPLEVRRGYDLQDATK